MQQVDPVTRRVIGHARQRHKDDWLQFANWSSVQYSSVRLGSCEHAFKVSTPVGSDTVYDRPSACVDLKSKGQGQGLE